MGTPSDNRVPPEVIGSLYDAVLGESDWSTALALCCSAFDAAACVTDFCSDVAHGFQYTASYGLSPELDVEYVERFAETDGRLPRELARFKCGVFRDRELSSNAGIHFSALYEELWIPNDYGHQLQCVAGAHQSDTLILTFLGQNQQGPFDDAAVEKGEILLPHLARLARINRRFDTSNLVSSATLDALDSLSTGVAVLDRTGEILYLNTLAEVICSQRDGLTVSGGKLIAQRVADNRKLQGLIHGAITASRSTSFNVDDDTLCVARPSGKRSYSVVVSPVSRRTLVGTAPQQGALVFLADPDQATAHSEPLLACTFGFTCAEAKVATQLAAGASVPSVAHTLSITEGTACNYLKRLFQKTGTHRQGELISLLHRVSPGVAG